MAKTKRIPLFLIGVMTIIHLLNSCIMTEENPYIKYNNCEIVHKLTSNQGHHYFRFRTEKGITSYVKIMPIDFYRFEVGDTLNVKNIRNGSEPKQ